MARVRGGEQVMQPPNATWLRTVNPWVVGSSPTPGAANAQVDGYVAGSRASLDENVSRRGPAAVSSLWLTKCFLAAVDRVSSSQFL